MSTAQAMNHVAWSCDGKKLAAVGIDKVVRVWQPDKSVCAVPFCTLLVGLYHLETDEDPHLDGYEISKQLLWRT